MPTSRKTLLTSTSVGRLFLVFWIGGSLAILGRGISEIAADRGGTVLEISGDTYDYLLIRPRDYTDSDPPRPLIVFLHGSGEVDKSLPELRRATLVSYAGATANRADFPFLVVCPRGDGPIWEPDRLIALIDELLTEDFFRRSIDPTRIYLTGFSLGGYGTWQTAALYPDRFAAVVPVAGDCDPAWADSFGELPIWAFHGAKDRVVRPTGCVKTIDALRAIRGDTEETRLTLYPDREHGIAEATYRRADLYRWLLRYRSEKTRKAAADH